MITHNKIIQLVFNTPLCKAVAYWLAPLHKLAQTKGNGINFKMVFVSFCFALGSRQLFAQNYITNVEAKQQGKNVVITYDLSSKQSSSKFEVNVYCSTDGGSTWSAPLTALSGDVGKNVSPGNIKTIIWNVLAERTRLQGNNIVFELRAKPASANYTETTAGLNIEMIFVKGGNFKMGDQFGDGDDDEKLHDVTLSDFYMTKTEVTIGQYMKFVDETKGNYPEWLETGSSYNINDRGDNKNYYSSKGMSLQNKNYPITGVSWYNAVAYAEWLSTKTGKSYQLPTEAQWEYAAKGGASTGSAAAYKYSGSNNVDEVAWYSANSDSKTHAVATTSKANQLGIYDMSGNVWEWCMDVYAAYSTSPATNPCNDCSSTSSSFRVLRGGSWFSDASNCRVSYRYYNIPNYRNYYAGFRLVLVP